MIAEDLLTLYQKTSKHSNYQILPERLKHLLPENLIFVKSRNENERLDYIYSKLNIKGLSIADIGGNTGFFSFELLEKGAKQVSYYEGNTEHAQFVSCAAQSLGLAENLNVNNEYIDFKDLHIPKFDCILLLNVLHHIGDDYGDKNLQGKDVQKTILSALIKLSKQTKYLIFQVGFNWKGNRDLPIFNAGTKSEIIALISSLNEYYDILSTGIATKSGKDIVYKDVADDNLERDDSLGEFLNRPLFILQSKNFSA